LDNYIILYSRNYAQLFNIMFQKAILSDLCNLPHLLELLELILIHNPS